MRAMQAGLEFVSILEGKVDSMMLIAFKKLFPWRGEWKAMEYGQKMLMIKLHSPQKLEEICVYPFGLKGNNILVKIKQWIPANGASYKPHMWVKAFEVLENFHHRDSFFEAGSLIGS